MQQEHDDDLAPTVDERSELETEDFPRTEEEVEDAEDAEEVADDDIVGK